MHVIVGGVVGDAVGKELMYEVAVGVVEVLYEGAVGEALLGEAAEGIEGLEGGVVFSVGRGDAVAREVVEEGDWDISRLDFGGEVERVKVGGSGDPSLGGGLDVGEGVVGGDDVGDELAFGIEGLGFYEAARLVVFDGFF